MSNCEDCGARVVLVTDGSKLKLLDLETPVYVLPHPTTKRGRPHATLAHQGKQESQRAGVQYQYLAVHQCPPKPPKKRSTKK